MKEVCRKSVGETVSEEDLVYVTFLENSSQGDIINSFGWTTKEELEKPLSRVLRQEVLGVSLIYRQSDYLRLVKPNKRFPSSFQLPSNWIVSN